MYLLTMYVLMPRDYTHFFLLLLPSSRLSSSLTWATRQPPFYLLWPPSSLFSRVFFFQNTNLIMPLPCSLVVSHDLELRAKSLIWPLSLYLGCSPLPLFLSGFDLIPFLLAFLALAPLASFQHWLRMFPSSTGPHTYCSLSLECFSTTHSFRLVSPYSFIS